MNSKVTLIGLYSHVHPKNTSEERISNIVGLLKINNIEVNFVGNLPDNNDKLLKEARRKIDAAISNSCCIILVYSGWSESTGIINILSNYMHLPLIIWSLAGYRMESGLVAPAAAAGASLLRNTLNRIDTKYKCVYETLDSEVSIKKVLKYINLFYCLNEFKRMKIASIGYACSNLYPFMYDGNLIKETTGIHVDNLELLELKLNAEKVKEDEIKYFRNNFNNRFNTDKKISGSEIELLGKYYIATSKIIKKNNYQGISIKCGSGPGRFLGFTPCMLLSLIGDEINAICECDIYGLLAQTIINKLTGQKPTFLEVFEFYKDSVLMASCGFIPFSLCQNNYKKIYQHDWDSCGGLMNVSKPKTGEVTVFNFYVKKGCLVMQGFLGNAIEPENFQEEGWSDHKGPMIPSLEIRFNAGIDIFKDNIISPHYIVLYGNHIKIIEDYCEFAKIDSEIFY